MKQLTLFPDVDIKEIEIDDDGRIGWGSECSVYKDKNYSNVVHKIYSEEYTYEAVQQIINKAIMAYESNIGPKVYCDEPVDYGERFGYITEKVVTLENCPTEGKEELEIEAINIFGNVRDLRPCNLGRIKGNLVMIDFGDLSF